MDRLWLGRMRLCVALIVLLAAAFNIGPAQARSPVADGDADGVDDAFDQCLYTPPHAVVDSRGCSAQTDQDGDGFADNADDCPYTTAGAEVDSRGCAVDDDFDGVANGLDACSGTELGAIADARGCTLGQVATPIAPRPQAAVRAAAAATPSPARVAAAPTGPARAPVRVVIPAPPVARSQGPSTLVPRPAALLSLPFAAHSNNIDAKGIARLSDAMPALREALAAHRQAVLLVEAYADTESDGDAADTVARSRANKLRRLLQEQGIDSRRLRSVGHPATDAGAQFRRADVVLEID